MRLLPFMENLLAVEAEAKSLLAVRDRSYEQTLMRLAEWFGQRYADRIHGLSLERLVIQKLML